MVTAIIYEKLSHSEVAEKLGISRSSVQTYWERGRHKLMWGLHEMMEGY